MAEYALRRVESGTHQEGRPIDRVEAQNIFTHHVNIGRPILCIFFVFRIRKADASDVVGKRVEPHVHNMGVVPRDRDAPLERGAADREVPQAATHEGDHLVAPGLRADEIRVVLVMLEQPVLPGRQPEEIGRLLDPLDLRARGRDLLAVGRIGQLGLGIEGLVAHRVPTGVAARIDLARLHEPVPQYLAGALMARLGGADEIVVGEVEHAGQLAEVLRYLVGEGLRLHAGIERRLLDLLAVLVGAGQELYVIAVKTHEARQRIASQRRIRVADVRQVIDVIDRRRDVVRALGSGHGVLLAREPL